MTVTDGAAAPPRPTEGEMIMETDRLILRPWREDEAEALFAYASDPRVGPDAGWPVHASVDDSLAAIRRMNAEKECYAVAVKPSGEPIGSIGLTEERRGPMRRRSAEMGFWIGPEHRGRGYATEAALALADRAFEKLGLKTLWCASYPGNAASERVQEKCGFKPKKRQYDIPGYAPGTSERVNFSRLTARRRRRAKKRQDRTKGTEK